MTPSLLQKYFHQPDTLPAEVAQLVAQCLEQEKVQAYAMGDLDQHKRFTERWLILGERHVAAVEPNGEWRNGSTARSITKLPLVDIEKWEWLEGLSSSRLNLIHRDGKLLASLQFTRRQSRAMSNLQFLAEQTRDRLRAAGESSESAAEIESAEEYREAMLKALLEAKSTLAVPKMGVMMRLLSYLRPHWRNVAIGLSLAALLTGLNLLPPYLTGALIDKIIRPAETGAIADPWFWLWVLIGALAFVWAGGEFFSYLRLRIMALTGEKIAAQLRGQIYAHMQKLSLAFFSTRSTGSLITRVSSDTERLWDFITFGIIEIIVAVLQIIGVAIALMLMDWSLALLVLIPLPLMTWLFYRHSQRIQILFLRIWRKWSAMTGVLSDVIPGIRVVKAFAQEGHEIHRFEERNRALERESDNLHETWTRFWPKMVMLMHVCSLIVWSVGAPHEQKLAAVNERMISLGLKNTRLLNKLMSWTTKKNTPESLRYGIGVSTPADMVLLLEKMYRSELVDSSASREMIEVMSHQQWNSMIPRLLSWETEPELKVAHKTGSVTGVRVDVGLVFSPRTDFAIAVFCDKVRDLRDSEDNLAELAVAQAARLCWNYLTGDSTLTRPFFTAVDWQHFPAGEWARLYLHNAPFPHASRDSGYTYVGSSSDASTRKFFPRHPHYDDSTAIVIIPKGYHVVNGGNDLIIHFHGWWNDVDSVMEKFGLVQQLVESRKNAILVLVQGPYRAPDSHGGKMEAVGGFRRLVEEILTVLKAEKKIDSENIGRIIISAHSGGYRPAVYAVANGGLAGHIREVFLFDAFYSEYEKFLPWLKQNNANRLRSIYTEHLAAEHRDFIKLLKKEKLNYEDRLSAEAQIVLLPTAICHNCVMEGNFQKWLEVSGLAPIEVDKVGSESR